jgi:peptidyl-prolyl cis-trans isomerase B (cyclophilin B)
MIMPPKTYGKLALSGLTMLALIMVIGTWARAERSNPLVRLETSLGEITVELYPDKAPATVANFLQYVREGVYDGTIFHRVINGFMIQGGGLDANLNPKPARAPIQNEADNGLTNQPYTVAMARTSDPNSATNQFFINVADNKSLNHTAKTPQGWGYAVFGQVVQGREVVDQIKAVATGNRDGFQNVPLTPVVIVKATVVEKP